MKLFILLYGIAGILTGSFLNVCILRIPEGRSFISGRSACPVCGRTLRALELVPVLSWLFLGGKCRWCRANISIQYPAVELGMGILFSLTYFFRGTGFRSVILCAFFSLIITAAFIDGRHFYIPDGLSLLVLILGIVGFFADHGRFWPEFLRRMAGLVICGGGLWLLRILTGGGIGLGDVKMMAACGFFLGWPPWVLRYGRRVCACLCILPSAAPLRPCGSERPASYDAIFHCCPHHDSSLWK